MLPDARGHVMGLINQPNEYTATPRADVSGWADGDVSGAETHTLTIAEMPAHNHDISGGYLNVSGGVDPSENGQTSSDVTGITLGVSGEHIHTQTTTNDDFNNNSTYPDSTIPSYPNFDGGGSIIWTATINSAGTHTHDVIDPTHRHQIASNGGSLPHNNMQPTVFLGNLFIYGGRINQNITGFNGNLAPTSQPSYYPPQQNRKLY